ncbi:hypothetical protein MAIC_42240 [Mycolicibacterium aichiense]|uniref:Uncharacterized protein n=1 Tax=Mycolicibacterium aichiense TaxID=1799 RepID=A0AAD1MDZ5_9MYCO|nr:hypothetical protein MAIC_42240 [Mycolicibacterium aichiense]
MIPALGCAAVPLLTKNATTVSGVGRPGTAAALGSVAFAAAVVLGVTTSVAAADFEAGLDTFAVAEGVEPTWGRCCPVDLVELLEVLGPLVPAEPVESADAVAGIEASAAPMPSATADAPSQPPNSTGSARNHAGRRVIVDTAKEFIKTPEVDVRMRTRPVS